ncbi:MAG: hypothetical protein JJU28_13625 [Cyclobacteriaceae bacterium]|nr:hypothetical protein [Cyclobacteriaceae bacterium]
MRKNIIIVFSIVISSIRSFGQSGDFHMPNNIGDPEQFGVHIQRTMALLQNSTPEQQNTVRILFYGQSITEGDWWKIVRDDLVERFPNANLIIENLALGGYASQILVKTAETDLYPYQPDLLIFHVYGSHHAYENIIQRVRERTTSEILIQSDHYSADHDLNEERNNENLTPDNWTPWWNYVFLPEIAKRYDATLTAQRDLWRQYLIDNDLDPQELLTDNVHANDHGNFLMAELLKPHLLYRPELEVPRAKSPFDNEWIQTLNADKLITSDSDSISFRFKGNRVDLIAGPGGTDQIDIWINHRKPSQHPGLYGFTRTTPYPDSKWPLITLVESKAPLELETWTVTLHDISDDVSEFRFNLHGSKTGFDGSGHSNERFISNSERIIIDPENWNIKRSMQTFGGELQEGFEISWDVLPYFKDQVSVPASSNPAVENRITVVQGLSSGEHVITLTGHGISLLKAIRIYHPPLLNK